MILKFILFPSNGRAKQEMCNGSDLNPTQEYLEKTREKISFCIFPNYSDYKLVNIRDP